MLQRLLNSQFYNFANLTTIPSLTYPFEHMLSPKQFKFTDQRFEQFPASQKLFKQEHDHIIYVLNIFQQFFNSGNSSTATKQFIKPSLFNQVNLFRSSMKQQQLECKISIDSQKLDESKAYLEYYGYEPNTFIHQYFVDKSDEKVNLIHKQNLKESAKKSLEDQLKEDMKEVQKENSLGQKIKETITKKKSFGSSENVWKIAQFFEKSYKNSKKANEFKSYILVNRIQGKMKIQISSKENKQPIAKFDNVDLITKWCYQVNYEEPQSVRKSRKRQLFDFQLWNRGCFIPIKTFI